MKSVMELLDIIDCFLDYSGLNSNIHSQKWNCWYWCTERSPRRNLWFKICWFNIRYSGNIRVFFSYNENLQNKKKIDIQNTLTSWRKGSLTEVGKNDFQNTSYIKSSLSCTVGSGSVYKWIDKDQTNFIWKISIQKSSIKL